MKDINNAPTQMLNDIPNCLYCGKQLRLYSNEVPGRVGPLTTWACVDQCELASRGYPKEPGWPEKANDVTPGRTKAADADIPWEELSLPEKLRLSDLDFNVMRDTGLFRTAADTIERLHKRVEFLEAECRDKAFVLKSTVEDPSERWRAFGIVLQAAEFLDGLGKGGDGR